MTNLIMLFVVWKRVLLFTAKRDNSQEIGQAFEKLIAKEDWSELEILRQAAHSYHPTEMLESEIHRLLADKEK